MLLPKLSCVYIPCLMFVTSRVCLAKVSFFAFFRPDMNTEIVVVIYMYLKNIPQIILIVNIYEFICMARWDPAHVSSRVKLYMHTKC